MLPVIFLAGGIFASATQTTAAVTDNEISALISSGRIAQARAEFERSNPTQAQRLFFEGRVAKARGALKPAIGNFRQALRLDPGYLNARRELAHTLMLDGQFSAAEYHFRELLRIDKSTAMRAGYQRFLGTIAARRPMGVSAEFALLPSSNINNGTTNTVFDTTTGRFTIDPGSRVVSGLGARLGVSGYFRKQYSPQSRITLNWGLSGTKYKNPTYNSATGTLALAYEHANERSRWSITPHLRHSWRGDDGDNTAVGLVFSLDRRLSVKNTLSISLGRERRFYPVQSYRDGPVTTATFSLSHQLSPALSVWAGVGGETGRPVADHLKYGAVRVFAGVARAWEGGLNTRFSLELGRRDFVGDYPLTTSPRKDSYYSLSATVFNSRVSYRGFTPRLSCSYSKNSSNVAFYDFDSTDCQLGLTRQF